MTTDVIGSLIHYPLLKTVCVVNAFLKVAAGLKLQSESLGHFDDTGFEIARKTVLGRSKERQQFSLRDYQRGC